MNYLTELIVVGALVLTLAVRALTVNRLIRSKLRLSLLVFAAYLLFPAVAYLSPDLVARIQAVGHLLLALGVINFVVVLAINPWRVDRVPEHFPNILQDALILGVFLLAATVVMGEKFITTSAVGAVVIGLALQDTLGNLFAGLALQIETPFRVGHWVRVGSLEGQVTEITWRATVLCTKTGNTITVPNNIISKEAIVNFSQPEVPTRLQVEVGISYDAPPNQVKAVMLEALRDAPLVLSAPPADVSVAEFGASAVIYHVKFWIADYRVDAIARDQVLSLLHYALRRAALEIPYPIQVEYRRELATASLTSDAERAEFVGRIDVFADLPADDRARLALLTEERLFGSGQTIVREGDPGASMFLVARGRVRVSVGEQGNEVATIGPGGYFGEMSLLTGDARTATVAAIGDCILLEVSADDFRSIALANPYVVERVSAAVAERRVGLDRSRIETAAVAVATEAPRSFITRVQQFLRLPVR